MFNKLKAGISDIRGKGTISIPITADILNGILKRYRIDVTVK